MPTQVRILQPLRRLAGDQEIIEINAQTVGEVIDQLDAQFPGFRERICDGDRQVKRFINIYVDGEDIRFLNGLSTAILDKSEISIVPAIAGG
jgi:molybdopterin synthase sulfur carrier subunit